MNNKLEVWFSEDNPAYSDYIKRNELFGTDYNLVIAYNNRNLFTIHGIKENIRLLQTLNNLPSVKQATGLASLPIIFSNGMVLPPLKESKTFTEERLLKIKQQIVTNKLYLHQFISEDGQKTAIVVKPANEDINTYQELASQVEKLLNTRDFSSLNYHLSGALYALVEFDKISTQESAIFVTLCLLVIFILCILYFKRFRIAMIPIIIVIASLIVTYAVFAMTKNALSMVSSIMPIIIMIIAIALNMHILQRLHSSNDRSLYGLTKALVGVIKPCFLGSITTAV
ncbi:MAG: MMPL family transporter, partial [Perlabentimonas sp.]